MANESRTERGAVSGVRPAVTGGAGSWAALVAATTLGLGAAGHVRAAIKVDGALPGGAYRLVVQSYAEESLAGDRVPRVAARPIGSVQREVSAEELRKGLRVSLLELGPAGAGDHVIVAWIERGSADLEFGAFRARPGDGAYYGVARSPRGSEAERAELVLRRRIA